MWHLPQLIRRSDDELPRRYTSSSSKRASGDPRSLSHSVLLGGDVSRFKRQIGKALCCKRLTVATLCTQQITYKIGAQFCSR